MHTWNIHAYTPGTQRCALMIPCPVASAWILIVKKHDRISSIQFQVDNFKFRHYSTRPCCTSEGAFRRGSSQRWDRSKIITVWENNFNIALFVLAVIFRSENKPLIWLLHEVILGVRILNLLIQHHRDFFYKNNNFINLQANDILRTQTGV